MVSRYRSCGLGNVALEGEVGKVIGKVTKQWPRHFELRDPGFGRSSIYTLE